MQKEGESNIVAFPQPDLTRVEPLAAAMVSRPSAASSDIERDVIALFDTHRNRLLAYVMAFGVSGHDSEEIVQEVFLALFRHLQMGKSRRNLHAWMFRVAHNLALKQRHASRRWSDRIESYQTLMETQSNSSPNPEEQALSAQRRRRLLAVFGALPEQDQCCLRLRAEGLRYREIAHVLDISLGAVSISLTRSLARLMRADRK
jgi:RNA polymerase sigma-70 factor, ECF subfamily